MRELEPAIDRFIFNREEMRKYPGAVLHARTYGRFGRLIRRALSVQLPPPLHPWGNHTAIYLPDPEGIGDSEPLRAKTNPLEHYEALNARGQLELRVHLPAGWTPRIGWTAANYWRRHVDRSWYDLWAFPRLLRKALLGQHYSSEAGKTWARWCTEGVYESYLHAWLDIYHKKDPTPYTHEKRVREGAFEDITHLVLDQPRSTA